MKMKEEFTLTVFSENRVGLLSQITNVFTRRHLNIESLTTSESAIAGIHKFTIETYSTRDEIEKVAGQIEKKIDVIKVYFYTIDEIIHQEVALYKVNAEALLNGNEIEQLVRKYGARILEVTKEYAVIEKTGHKGETQELFEKLDKFGVSQFTRSGRIAITKAKTEFQDSYLRKISEEQSELN